MKEIWIVTEYILTEARPTFGEEGNIGWYTSKEKGIEAVYNYFREELGFSEQDIQTRIVKNEEDPDDIIITTKCGEDYGLYESKYEIDRVTLDEPFGG